MNDHLSVSIRKFLASPVVVLAALMAGSLRGSEFLPLTCYQNQQDYSYMWWMDSIKTGNATFAIQTSRYAFSFDYPNLSVGNFIITRNPVSELSAHTQGNDESFPASSPCGLSFGAEVGGTMTWCTTTSGEIEDCQLVETGKYFQRRFITNLPELAAFQPDHSGLEISSWPDRLALILKATPASDLKNVGLEMKLSFPEAYSVILQDGEVMALKNPADGSGFVILKSVDATRLTIEGNTVRVSMGIRQDCPLGKEMNCGMIVYPVAEDIDAQLAHIARQQRQPLLVEARQIAPLEAPLNVVYDQDLGWHRVRLRSDETTSKVPVVDESEGNPGPPSHALNNRMERVMVTVANPTSEDRVLRLNFAKGRLVPDGSPVFAVPGISAVFRDLQGNPVGIPIQLSKNWHSGGRTGRTHYFEGPWYHGLSMLTIPANASISFEYTSVNALWGGVPAASHAQLCLIGWGSNQQWDESAIGAWGETITYEPDLDQAKAPVLDFRPLLVRSNDGKQWGWTGNMGGADFFNLTKLDGSRAWHSRIRTHYNRYSPNLTEVTYAGTMDNGALDFEYTASVGRSDDLTRGIYKLKLKVNKDTPFQDFVIFQAGARTYHYVKSHTLAWGNEHGLKQQWTATIGTTDQYITPKQVAEGEVPWFSFTDSEFSPPRQKFIPANRGFVIRKWKARINGQDDTPPWFAEFNATTGHGESSGLINITAPDACSALKAGDYIEAEIVLFITPAAADDYYGPNINFQAALKQHANTWQMTYREAVGNQLDVTASRGTVVDDYPIRIKADGGVAEFAVTGGLGYVPLTITRVGDYQNPQLFRKANGVWERIDQSVHGNDFWQTEYDAASGAWEISYNLDLDTPGDARQTAEFRFGRAD